MQQLGYYINALMTTCHSHEITAIATTNVQSIHSSPDQHLILFENLEDV